MFKKMVIVLVVCVFILFLNMGCKVLTGTVTPPKNINGIELGEIDHSRLVDGQYTGSHKSKIKSIFSNTANVEITIKDQSLVDLNIEIKASGYGKQAEDPVRKRILEEQSTFVDALTGATTASVTIMAATQKAIEKAYK